MKADVIPMDEMLDKVYDYMRQWKHEEDWTDFNIALNSGDLDLMSHMLVESGAIDSNNCYEECQKTEKLIERMARNFRRQSEKLRNKAYDSAFEGCNIYSCPECNHVSFVNDGNEELYEDELKTCWGCESKKVVHTIWKGSK